MPTPVDLLTVIQTTLTDLEQANADFSSQQQPFVNHLTRTTSELRAKIDPMPQTDMALRRLIPRFGDELLQRIAALFGYARLLLDSPQSFDNATLSPQQASNLQTIYQHGKYLYDLIEAIQQSAHAERVENHKAPTEAISIGDFLEAQTPVWAYLVRDKPIALTIHKEDATVQTSPYHLAALFDHVIITLADDVAIQDELRISGRSNPDDPAYNITLSCKGGVADRDTWEMLFAKNGRYMYLRRLQQYGGDIQMFSARQRGVDVRISLPCRHEDPA